MYRLFSRLENSRRRIIAKRQVEVEILLVRDINQLVYLEAIGWKRVNESDYPFSVRLEWPTTITESAFFDMDRKLWQSKARQVLP